MATAVEPFSFAIAELSDKYIHEFPCDIVPKYMETLKNKTGVQIITGYGRNSIGIQGSWLSLSMAHSYLVEFLAKYRTKELADANCPVIFIPDTTETAHVQHKLEHTFNKRSYAAHKPSGENLSVPSTSTAAETVEKSGKCIENERGPSLSPTVDLQINRTILSGGEFQEKEFDSYVCSNDDDAGVEFTGCTGFVLETGANKYGTCTQNSQNGRTVRKENHCHFPEVRIPIGRSQKQDVKQKKSLRSSRSSLKVKHTGEKATSTCIRKINITLLDSQEMSFISPKSGTSDSVKTDSTEDVCKSTERKARDKAKELNGEKQRELCCLECQYKADSNAKLTDHIRRHHKGSPASCDLCGKVFPNQTYMQRHRSSHVAPLHCCDICGKLFKIHRAMVKHRKTHEEGYAKPAFQCEICPKTFCSQYIVDCHVKSFHMGQHKNYLCSFCGKKFTTNHSLQEHSNAHTGNKPHICEVCGKGFSYDSALRDHRFTHEEEKQFQCSHCYKTFCQRSGLKMHLRIHENTKHFQCEECGREFTQKQALQRHERVHKGVKPFICKFCSRSFTDASIIRRHLILVHKTHKDAKTWREDIICMVKPNAEYHVGLVVDKTAAKVQTTSRAKSKQRLHRTLFRDLDKAGSLNNDKKSKLRILLEEAKTVSQKAVIPYSSETLNSHVTTNVTEDSTSNINPTSLQDQLRLNCASISAETMTDSPTLQNNSASNLALTKVLPAVPRPSHILFPTMVSLPQGNVEQNREQVEEQVSASGDVAETQSFASSLQPDTNSHLCLPHAPFPQESSIPTVPKLLSTIFSEHHLSNSDFSANGSTPTCIDSTLATTTTTTLPASISTPHTEPWRLFYLYSRLASQFGMHFADYPYVATGALSSVEPGAGIKPGVGPLMPGVECPSAVDSVPQDLSISHGHSNSEVLTDAQLNQNSQGHPCHYGDHSYQGDRGILECPSGLSDAAHGNSATQNHCTQFLTFSHGLQLSPFSQNIANGHSPLPMVNSQSENVSPVTSNISSDLLGDK